MDYIILKGNTPTELSEQVKDWMTRGWTPQGGVATDVVFKYIQAMVK